MQQFIFTNVLGSFVFDSNGKLVRQESPDALNKNHDLKVPDAKTLRLILAHFRQKENFALFHEQNIILTRESLREAVHEDTLIIQVIDSIAELDKVANTVTKRAREWYGLYNPELQIVDNQQFVSALASARKPSSSAGADLPEKDVRAMESHADAAKLLFDQRQRNEEYLDSLMKSACPNVRALAGSLIGAKLISLAGSLKHLSELPASTVQILGAEKALFRHMHTGAKPPKFGVLFQHQLVQTAKRTEQGRAARLLADKISIAAKVDYFKGTYIGDSLLEEVRKKMGL